MNNIPIHSPLFPPDLLYGSDDTESVSVLVEVPEPAVRELLAPTPFEFVSAHAWIEIMAMRSAFGVEPFAGGGVIVPARYRDVTGGYYAFCYIDQDDALALGREPFGYPKKFARSHVQRTGRAATASMVRKDAHLEVSVILGDPMEARPEVPRYPHLLLQVFPSAESSEILLKRVIARDTAKASNMTVEFGEAAVAVLPGKAGNELHWMQNAKPVHGSYARGAFRGALATVLGTESVGAELRHALGRE